MTESTTLVKVLGTEGETNLVLKSEGCLFQHFWWLTEGYSQRPAFISPILELPNGSGSYWRSSWCCSVAQLCPTICSPMDCSIPGFPGHHHLRELAQTHVHWVGDAIQSSQPLSSPSPPPLNLSQHQGLFQWVSSLHQVAKVLQLQLQHQNFQWIFRTDFL